MYNCNYKHKLNNGVDNVNCIYNHTYIHIAGSPDTTLAEPHPNSNTQQTKNETANVVVQQHSRKLLKMGILMPETC